MINYFDRIRKSNQQRLVFALLLPTLIMVLTALVLFIIQINTTYWGIPIGLSMLLGNFVLIYALNLSYDDLGLVYNKNTIGLHIFEFIVLVLFVFLTLYMAHIDISQSLSSLVLYDIVFFTIAALADELYFRGIIYRLLEVWDEKTAFIGSSIIYGFWTIAVGYVTLFNLSTYPNLPIPINQLERIIFALSLCLIRYTTRMIYLTIPAHIMINMHNQMMISSNILPDFAVLSYSILVLAIGLNLGFSEVLKKRNNSITSTQI